MPLNVLTRILDREVNRHCQIYAQDVTYLGQILNLNIVSKNVVFVSEKNKKYHNKPFCSGMQAFKEMTLEEAQKHGYTPCKRCVT